MPTDVVTLIPSTITQTQTLYAVSFIASPTSNTSRDYTMRPAVYVQGANSSTFNLIAQAAQTTIPGSTFVGNFVELFFPLLTPVNVIAGQVVYINRLVDQAGLALLFSQTTSGTFYSNTFVTSAQSAPAVLTTQGTGGIDASHATFGCNGSLPAPASSSATVVVGASSSASGGVSSSSSTAAASAVSAAPMSSIPVVIVRSSSGSSNPGGNPGGNGASAVAVSSVVTLTLAVLAISALLL